MFFLMVRVLFIIEVAAAAWSYINAHISETVTEREIEGLPDESVGGDVYGIGVGTGNKTVFWFHSRTEAGGPGEGPAEESGKE